MFIEKVKVEGTPDEFGGRVISIKTREMNFKTPYRVPTSTEYRYKQEVPCDIPFEPPISEIISDFTEHDLKQFLTGNGPFKNRLDRARNNKAMMSYSGLLLYPQTPKLFELNLRARKEFVELQMMCGVDIITHPVRWSKNIERELSSLVDEVENRGGGTKDVMPYVDMGLNKDDFCRIIKILSKLSETGTIHSVGLIHRPRERFIQNYLTLWEMRDHDWWVHTSGIPRRQRDPTPSAEIHALQYFGIDTYSIKTVKAFSSQKGKNQIGLKAMARPPKASPPQTIKRFDDASLGYLKENEWYSDYPKDKTCDCPVCKGRTRKEFDDEYIIGLDGNENRNRLDQASKIHEFFSSSTEFDISREYISDGEFMDYIKKKKYFPILNQRLN